MNYIKKVNNKNVMYLNHCLFLSLLGVVSVTLLFHNGTMKEMDSSSVRNITVYDLENSVMAAQS